MSQPPSKSPAFVSLQSWLTRASLLVFFCLPNAFAGSPSPFQKDGAATTQTRGPLPSPNEGKVVLKSFDSARSLPGQLYQALRLAKSDVLIKTSDRVSLSDPHANLDITCTSQNSFTCTFGLAKTDLGWAVSEVSSQAILYHALEGLYESRPASPTATRDRLEPSTVRYSLNDGRDGSYVICARRENETVEFNCQLRLNP